MNANTFASIPLLQSPVPTTETIVLNEHYQTDTTRARSLLQPRADVATGLFDGIPFRLHLAGKVSDTVSENITVAAYLNLGGNTNLTTFTNDIKVLNTSTMATGSTTAFLSFFLNATMLWDSGSGRLAFFPDPGGLKSISGTSAVSVATAVIGNSGTAIPATTGALANLNNIQFFVTGLAGTSAQAVLTVTDFSLEQL